MTTPFRCLLVIAVLPYVLASLGGYFRLRQLGSLDNNHPRIQATRLEGIAARAWAAQANAWEALAVFGVVTIVAHLAHADPVKSATASLVIGTRIAHPILYVANLAVLRTLVFIVGLGCIAWLIDLAVTAA